MKTKKIIYKCSQCGSEELYMEHRTHMNTGKEDEEWHIDECIWCENCKDYVGIEEKHI